MAILEKIIDKDLLGEFLSELKSMLDALQTDWGDVKSKPFSTLDGSTVESANGALQVKDGGITKAKLASDAVAPDDFVVEISRSGNVWSATSTCGEIQEAVDSGKRIVGKTSANLLLQFMGILTNESGSTAAYFTNAISTQLSGGSIATYQVLDDGGVISTESKVEDYTLPAATESTLGGVKVGDGLSVASDGTLSAAGSGGAYVIHVTKKTGGAGGGGSISGSSSSTNVVVSETAEEIASAVAAGKPIIARVLFSGATRLLATVPMSSNTSSRIIMMDGCGFSYQSSEKIAPSAVSVEITVNTSAGSVEASVENSQARKLAADGSGLAMSSSGELSVQVDGSTVGLDDSGRLTCLTAERYVDVEAPRTSSSYTYTYTLFEGKYYLVTRSMATLTSSSFPPAVYRFFYTVADAGDFLAVRFTRVVALTTYNNVSLQYSSTHPTISSSSTKTVETAYAAPNTSAELVQFNGKHGSTASGFIVSDDECVDLAPAGLNAESVRATQSNTVYLPK